MPQSFLRCVVILRCFRCANFYVLLVSAILNSTFGRLRHPKVHFTREHPLEPRPPFSLRSKNRPQNPKRIFERGSKTALISRRLIFTRVKNSLEYRNDFLFLIAFFALLSWRLFDAAAIFRQLVLPDLLLALRDFVLSSGAAR